MTYRTARNLAVTGAAIVSAALLTVLSGTGASAAPTAPADPGHALGTANPVAHAAVATTARVNAPAQPVPNAFRLENAHSGWCVSEDGDTGLIGLGTCNENHSQYWYFTNPGPLVNAHSGKCLQIDGYSTTVPLSAATCDFDNSQNWDQDFGEFGFLFVNAHSGLCLQGQGTALYQGGGNECSNGWGETIFNWYEV